MIKHWNSCFIYYFSIPVCHVDCRAVENQYSYFLKTSVFLTCSIIMFVMKNLIRLATRALLVVLMTFMITQQRTRAICSPKFIAIFVRLEKVEGQIRLQGCEILSFHWIRETVQIEVIIVRPSLHVNISEHL